MHIETRTILKTTRTDSEYGSIGTPLYQTSNFRFRDVGVSTGYDYTRSGNPTRHTLEEVLAELEGGARAVAVSTGMAAISTVLAHFEAGSHIIATHDCYGGTARLLSLLARQGKLEVSFVDLGNIAAVADAVRPNTRCLWIETPSNPLLDVVDVGALARLARAHDILVAVDNTFLSPFNFQPFRFGADIVVHSTTKWLNGHSDVIGGAIISRTTELGERFQYLANALGTTTGSFDSWLVLRGIKTLAVRMRHHEASAKRIARFLEAHPLVSKVYYPGLTSHATHGLAKAQFTGFGGVISFRLEAAAEDCEVVHELLRATKIFTLAESLGGVESLIEQPSAMSHASMTEEQRTNAGITPDLIRISVGIEDADDLIADLEQALRHAARAFAGGLETSQLASITKRARSHPMLRPTIHEHTGKGFALECGAVLGQITTRYATYGTLNEARTNVVLVLHALTGWAEAHEWWSGIIGPGCVIDPVRDLILSPNLLGSCYGSTGPDSLDPETGLPYEGTFPALTIRDIARALIAWLDGIGFSRVKLAIGGSMGGMVLLEMAALDPERFDAMIPIAVTHSHSAWRIAFSSSVAEIITAFDPRLSDRKALTRGMKLARRVAMTTYRSAREFDQRFARNESDDRFEVERYLAHQGEKIAARFSPYSYLALTRAMSTHDLERGRGAIAEVARAINSHTLFIGITSDILYLPEEIELLAALFPRGTYKPLEAEHGHDSFLIDTAELADLIGPFLKSVRAQTKTLEHAK